ncbi:MAG: hypothetical protein IID30_07190 [Planctomycetes bacterium]|nr:hypothetical protein [Planctomycetota bacterium]
MATASRALLKIPREAWDAGVALSAAQAILTWANDVPARDRTGEGYITVSQAGVELCSFVGSTDSARIQKELLGLGVPVFVIRSVREQMRFDVTQIVVEAGQEFEIIFVNEDMIPHNVVIVEPGAREEIGLMADEMDPTPDRRGRTYVPRDRRIIAASRMIEPGRRTSLKLKAPETPGDYEYVCTYPEHWLVMFGKLIVVEDLEQYLQSGLTPP